MTPMFLEPQSLTWLGSYSREGATSQPVPIPESWGDRARGNMGDLGLGSTDKEILTGRQRTGLPGFWGFPPLQSLGERLAGEGPRSPALGPSFNPIPLLSLVQSDYEL